MNEFLNFTVIGLVTGAAYAIAAGGLVVTYATSGIFNIGHGAIGMLMAYVFWQLVDQWHWNILLAAVVVVGILAPLFGAFVEVTVMRRVRGHPLAITLVVTIALLVFLIFLADWGWKGQLEAAPSFFGHSGWHLTSKVFVSWQETITIVLAGGAALFLRLLLYRTRIGVAMRAVVDNRDLAALNGARPAWVGTFSWAVGGGAAALAGILIAPILNNLSVLPLTFLVVYAYAAAVLGRLRSLPLTFLGGMILGLAYSYLVGYAPQDAFFNSPAIQGLRESLPVVMLLVVLLAMKPDSIEGGRLRTWRQSVDVASLQTSVVGAVVLIVGAVVFVEMLSAADVVNLGVGICTAIIVLSLIPLAGWGGQVSLCQMTFAGLGAFAMSRVGGGSLLGLLAAMGMAGAVGAIVAAVAVRLRGLYLALLTLAFAVAMDNMFFQTPLSFGFGGNIHINRPSFLGLHFRTDASFVVAVAVVFAALAITLLMLRRGPFGRMLLAMKDSEAACATLGMSLTLTKLAVFAMSAAIAGLGGALLGAMTTEAGAITFASQASLPILLLAVIFGISTTSGPLFAGVAYTLGGAHLQSLVPQIPNLPFGLTGLSAIGVSRSPDGVVPQVVGIFKRTFGITGKAYEELEPDAAEAITQAPLAPSSVANTA